MGRIESYYSAMTEAGKRFIRRIAPKPKPEHKRLKFVHLLATTSLPFEEIAKGMGWKYETAKSQGQILYEEAGVSSRLEFVFFCIVNGIVPCPCGFVSESPSPAARDPRLRG